MTNYYNIKTGEPAQFISIDSNDIAKVEIAGELMLIPWHEFVKKFTIANPSKSTYGKDKEQDP